MALIEYRIVLQKEVVFVLECQCNGGLKQTTFFETLTVTGSEHSAREESSLPDFLTNHLQRRKLSNINVVV